MAAHALHFPPAAPPLKLVVSRPAAVWPAPPPLVVAEPAMSATMKRCLLLALLLHVWLVLMLGNAPGGTAAPGQGVAGTLNITLQGPETPGATEVSAPPVPAVPEGAAGNATLPRWGGAVREQAVVVPATPGAAQLGRWSATPQPADAPEAPPPPPGRVVEERAQPAATAVLQAPPARGPAAAPALPALAPEAAAPALPQLATPLEAPTALPVPAALPTPQSAPPAERRLATPAARALPALGAALPSAPTVPAAPVLLPSAAGLPLPETITPRLQRTARPEAAELPALAPAAAVVPEAPPLAPAPAMPAPPALQPLARTPQPASLPSAVLAPGATPAATPSLPPAAFTPGAPDAGSRLGVDVATPPAAAASVPPRLNLQLARPRGGELSRGRSGGVLPLLPRPPEVDEKLGRDIAKAAKPDCKDAYRSAGLLGALPLAAQALKADSGCKW